MRITCLVVIVSTLLWTHSGFAQKKGDPPDPWADWPKCAGRCSNLVSQCKPGPVAACVCSNPFNQCISNPLLACTRKDRATVTQMASLICRLAAPPPAGPTPSPPSSNNQPLPSLIPTPSPPTDIPPSPNANTTSSIDTTNAPPVPSNPGHAVGNIPILSNSVTESPRPSNTIISVSSNRPTLTITVPASSNNTGTGEPLSTTAEHKKVNTGAIAGGVIGGLVALALLISLGVYMQRRARDARIERETMREMERVVPQPLPVDDEVYGYGYGTGTPMGMPYPNEKAQPIHLGYTEQESDQPQYSYGYPSEKSQLPYTH